MTNQLSKTFAPNGHTNSSWYGHVQWWKIHVSIKCMRYLRIQVLVESANHCSEELFMCLGGKNNDAINLSRNEVFVIFLDMKIEHET